MNNYRHCFNWIVWNLARRYGTNGKFGVNMGNEKMQEAKQERRWKFATEPGVGDNILFSPNLLVLTNLGIISEVITGEYGNRLRFVVPIDNCKSIWQEFQAEENQIRPAISQNWIVTDPRGCLPIRYCNVQIYNGIPFVSSLVEEKIEKQGKEMESVHYRPEQTVRIVKQIGGKYLLSFETKVAGIVSEHITFADAYKFARERIVSPEVDPTTKFTFIDETGESLGKLMVKPTDEPYKCCNCKGGENKGPEYVCRSLGGGVYILELENETLFLTDHKPPIKIGGSNLRLFTIDHADKRGVITQRNNCIFPFGKYPNELFSKYTGLNVI